MSAACTTGACSTPNTHLLSLELEGVTVAANDCVTVEHWIAGKSRDQGEFIHAIREHDGKLTVLVYTKAAGFRAVPTHMVHPCTAASSGAKR